MTDKNNIFKDIFLQKIFSIKLKFLMAKTYILSFDWYGLAWFDLV